ncbi:hypothetical protein FO519_000219 [Halicephalobus sp. NKZ332]|nr:hypothetical protein FO519_000219 [Halicephalobus sp. NKZ332]
MNTRPLWFLGITLILFLEVATASRDFGWGYPERANYVCSNDGLVIDNQNCSCKDKPYINGDHCGNFGCVNFGRAFATKDESDDVISFGCDCPSGFRGRHCEPVDCIPNADNRVKAFNPVVRTFSILMTFNDLMANLNGDNVTAAILDLVGDDSFNKSIDTLNIYLLGDTVEICPNANFPDFESCVSRIIYVFVAFGNTHNSYNLTSNDILDILKKSSTNSALMIIANIGLQDYQNATSMNRIIQTAVARQIEVSTIVASKKNGFQDVFHDDSFRPLINLAEKTLGSFIAPYNQIGGPYNDKLSKIIPKFGVLASAKTLVSANNLSYCQKNTFSFNLYADGSGNWDVYVSVYVDDASMSNFTPSIYPGNLQLFLDGGIWKLFKGSYNSSQNSYSIIITSNVAGPCNYRVWSTSEARLTSLPHTYIAYSTSDADANSALPVTGISNNVVAHLARLPSSMQSGFAVNVNLQSQNFSGTATSRDCLFNSALTSIACKDSNDYGRIQVTVNGDSYFEELLPVICVDPTDVEMMDEVTENDVFLDKPENDVFLDESEDYESRSNDSQISCTEHDDPELDPTSGRTLGLIFSNYKSLTNILTQETLDHKLFFDVLKNYSKSYNFKNYVSMGYTEDNLTNAKPASDFSTFQNDLVALMDQYKPDPNTPDGTDQALAVLNAASFLENFSDLFVITTVNFAARCAGTVIPISDKATIEQFFDYYAINKKALSETVISEFRPRPFAGGYSVSTFNYNRQYGSIYVMATVSSRSALPPTISINGGSPLNFTLIGDELGVFNLPSDISSSPVSIRVVNTYPTDSLLINVFQSNTLKNYVVAFTNTPTDDAPYSYPSFVGVGKLYPVARINEPDLANVQIINSTRVQINNGIMTERNTTTCHYDQIWMSNWQCTGQNDIYYIQLDTPGVTRTNVFTCFSESSGSIECQNGGEPDGKGNCTCPPGYTGDNCNEIVCYNGGNTTDANTCVCDSLYTGPHCDTATFKCQRQPKEPVYSTIMDTLILVIDRGANPGIIQAMKDTIHTIPSVFQQFILVTYYSADGDQFDIQVFNNKDYLVDYFYTLTDITGPVSDVRPILKRALYAAKTDRSLLVWAHGSDLRCGNSDRADNELMALLGKKNVEFRAFSSQKISSNCYRSIASLGNGIPVSMEELDFNNIVKYIIAITPKYFYSSQDMPTNLVVLDSAASNVCETGVTIDLAFETEAETILTVTNYVYELQSGDNSTMGSIIYKIASGTKKINLKCGTPSSKEQFYIYRVEALLKPRISFTFGTSSTFIAPGFAIPSDYGRSSFSFYLENIDNTVTDFLNFPVVQNAPMDVESYERFRYEDTHVMSTKCSYPWTAELDCDGEDGPIRIRINGDDINGFKYQRVITAYCISDSPCLHGTKLSNGACGCDPWWSGTDCSIPTCLNNGIQNRESCSCPSGFFRDNCEFKNGVSDPSRNIMILLDVIDFPEPNSVQYRKDLATKFLETYRDSGAKFAYATNSKEDSTPQIALTDKLDTIISAINGQEVLPDNSTVDLARALSFFNDQISSSKDDGYSISYIFHITQHSPRVDEDLSMVDQLAKNGVGIFTAYYENDTSTDHEVIFDNAVLGGVTSSWTTYDIIIKFQKILQGGKITVPSPPPPTTTMAPKFCVYSQTFDTVFYADPTTAPVLGYYLGGVLAEFANDIYFDPTVEDASRATFGSNSSPTPLCLSDKNTFKIKVASAIWGQPGDKFVLSEVILENLAEILSNKNRLGARDVPRFLVLASDKSDIDNYDTVVANITKIKEDDNIAVIFIGLGTGDFSKYVSIANPGMLIRFTGTDDIGKISGSWGELTCGSCPQGTSCDSNTGICRQFRPPANLPAINFCDNVYCGPGRQCDSNTGRCVVFRDPAPSHSRCSYIQCPTGYQCDWNYGICRSFQDPSVKSCENVFCPQGTTCDSNTGTCRQFRPPTSFRRVAPSSMTDYCKTVRCPNDFYCDPSDGICRAQKVQVSERQAQIFLTQPIPDHPPSPSIAWQRPAMDFCPPNSEYNECGSRCPYTCTELHPRCTSNQHNCIGTCQCVDGYVQASSANITCVPARACSEIGESICTGLKCPNDMICVDGYCNPVNCPPILKPHLDRGCQYELVRDTRNCVALKSSCE